MNADANPAKAIFLEAVEQHDPDRWSAFLDRACAGQPDLRCRVEVLLEAHREAGTRPHGAVAEGAASSQLTTVEEPSARERPGTVIGPYKLLEQIGEGGFGGVFLAEQTQPVRRKVALKILKPGMDTRQVVARFEAERQALAIMDHPNIAKVFDGGATPSGRPYFVMELVKGVPITEFCDQQKLTTRKRLELFVAVCQAVQHAHQKGIIHRDLKPSNVLVSRHDTTPVVKVIDFGVAKALGQELTDKTLFTGIAQMIGTPLYMAPEQAGMSDLDVDTRSDIYSLGVLLYELLTGTTPFPKERFKSAGYEEIRRIIREEEPPKPSTRLTTLGPAAGTVSANRGSEPRALSRLVRGEMDWIVMNALEKDRNRRYETASGFAADVQRYLADEPVQACPPSAGYRLRKFVRRNRRALVVLGLVLSLIVLSGGVLGWVVRDRAVRQQETARQISANLDRARQWIDQNRIDLARHELAEARGRIGADHAAANRLAEPIEALQSELDRFENFFTLIDRAHEAEFAAPAPLISLRTNATGKDSRSALGRKVQWGDKGKAVPHLVRALSLYRLWERDDWLVELEGGSLGPDQVRAIRRACYEKLLWLAEDLLRWREDHRSGETLSRAEAARRSLSYLQLAETAWRPTWGFYLLRANARERAGEADAARADRALVDRTPPSIASDHFLRAVVAYEAGSHSDAVNHFGAALRLEPTHYWSLLGQGRALFALGEREQGFARAAAVCTGCIMKRPDHAFAYSLRASAAVKLGRPEEAIADRTRVIELEPRYADAWLSRGLLYADLRQPEKALADFDKAVELNPTDATTWECRCVAFIKLGRPEKALADVTKAIELAPGDALSWYNQAVVYTRLGDTEKELASLNRALELDPTYAPAWYKRGTVYMNLGRLEPALADLTKAVELGPKDPEAWNNRGVVHMRLHQWDKAQADFARAVELNPGYALAWRNKAQVHLNLGRWDLALKELSKYLELDSKDAHVWSKRGWAHMQLNQLDKAIADYDEAIRLGPPHALLWSNRSVAHLKLKLPDKALADSDKAIEVDSRFAPAWFNRGEAFRQLGQWERAADAYLTSLRLGTLPQADFQLAHTHLATLLTKVGNKEEARKQYEQVVKLAQKAVDLAPKDCVARQMLGWAQYRSGAWKAGIETLEASCKLQDGGTGDCGQWIVLALAHGQLANEKELPESERARHKAEARRWYDQAVKQIDSWGARGDGFAEAIRAFRREAAELLGVKEKQK